MYYTQINNETNVKVMQSELSVNWQYIKSESTGFGCAVFSVSKIYLIF